MRHLVLKDKKISDSEYKEWEKKDFQFFKEHCDFENTYYVLEHDYSDYPTYVDSDGDIRPTATYLYELAQEQEARFGKWAFEHIMVMVHEDNWKSDTDDIKGIWGTNYSYKLSNNHIEYSRWDRDNLSNTFGTAYHERMHAFDALIHTEIGVNVNPILNVSNYDAEVVHGKSDKYKYIRYQENLEALKKMAPYIKQATEARMKRYVEELTKKVSLWQQILYLSRELRRLQNKKVSLPTK